MRTYRIVAPDGMELARTEAPTLLEAIARHPIDSVPVGAQLLCADGTRVLAQCETWVDSCRGWSLATAQHEVCRLAVSSGANASDRPTDPC